MFSAYFVVICSGPQDHELFCLHLKMSSAHALEGVSGVASFITTDGQPQ